MLTDEMLMRNLMRAASRARRRPPEPEQEGQPRLPFGKGYGYILELLTERDGISQQQLAAAAGIRPQSVSEAISSLEGHGFVRREPSTEDRRVMLIYLTPEGRDYHRVLSQQRRIHAQHYFSVLEETEKETLNAILQKLVSAHRECGDQTLEKEVG